METALQDITDTKLLDSRLIDNGGYPNLVNEVEVYYFYMVVLTIDIFIHIINVPEIRSFQKHFLEEVVGSVISHSSRQEQYDTGCDKSSSL